VLQLLTRHPTGALSVDPSGRLPPQDYQLNEVTAPLV